MQTCLQLPGRNRLYGAVKFPSPISDFLPTCAQAIPVLRFGRHFVSALLPDGSVQAWVHGVRAVRRPPLRKRKNSQKFFMAVTVGTTGSWGVRSADPEKKDLKKVWKKFGGKEKVRIFAVPFGNGGDGERRRGFPGRRKRSLTRLRKYKNNKVPRTGKRLTRALIPSRNEQQSGSLREI